jgi:hypothetical protein
MISLLVRILLLSIFFWTLLVTAQRRPSFPQPPQSANRPTVMAEPKATHIQRLDPFQLQRDARELADLAQTVPTDVDKVNHGLLPKDASEKLKRIEKLAKRLRSEMAP